MVDFLCWGHPCSHDLSANRFCTEFSTASARIEIKPMRLQGLPSISAQRGAWGAAGMVSNKPGLADHLARLGLGLLRPQEGLHALSFMMRQAVTPAGASALRSPRNQSQALTAYTQLRTQRTNRPMPDLWALWACVCAGDGMAAVVASRLLWTTLLVAGRERSPFYAEHLHAQRAAVTLTSAQDSAGAAVRRAVSGTLRTSTPAATPSSVPQAGRDWAAAGAALVADTVQRLLGRPLRPDEPFMSAGLDSLGALPICLVSASCSARAAREQLCQWTGCKHPHATDRHAAW